MERSETSDSSEVEEEVEIYMPTPETITINPYMLTQKGLHRLTGRATLTLPGKKAEVTSNPDSDTCQNLVVETPLAQRNRDDDTNIQK